MCLRGAGDVRVPALLVLPVSLLLFVPLAHALTFAPGQGWVHVPAAVRLGCGRWLGRGAHLCHGARQYAVPALALARLAGDPSLTAQVALGHVRHAEDAAAHRCCCRRRGRCCWRSPAPGSSRARRAARATRRTGWVLLLAALASLWLLATPLVADCARRAPRERCPPLDLTPAGDRRRRSSSSAAASRAAATPPSMAASPAVGPRAARARRLRRLVARRTGLPVLVSGTPREALAMRASLARDFGVAMRWVEDRSRGHLPERRSSRARAAAGRAA